MKKLLLSTAIVAAASAPVFAQTTSGSDSSAMSEEEQTAASSESSGMSEESAATAEEGADMAAGSESTTDTAMTGDAAVGVTPTREGYMTAADEQLTAEALTGAVAYDANDQEIGEVSELLLAADGKIESVIVDVGGFLGIGEKPVQLELSKLDIMTSEDGTDFRVYISMPEEELKAMPEYEE